MCNFDIQTESGDRAGDMQVNKLCWGLCILNIEKALMGTQQILHGYLGLGHRVFIFNFPDFDSCVEYDKVGSELMCLFVEKLSSF